MDRREMWHKVLASEVERWSAKSYEQLVEELFEVHTYEIEFDSSTHQVEVELIENTAEYVHVLLAVDDGSLPGSILPATDSFIRRKSTLTSTMR